MRTYVWCLYLQEETGELQEIWLHEWRFLTSLMVTLGFKENPIQFLYYFFVLNFNWNGELHM
jgi:hypothetical protein